MKRHWILGLVLAASALTSVVVGHSFGRHQGEVVMAKRLSELSSAEAASTPAGKPPKAGTAARIDGSTEGKPRTRDEIARILDDLKKRMYQSSGSAGSLQVSLNEAEVAEVLDRLSLEEIRLAMDLVNEMPPGMNRTAYSMTLLQRWAREDPAGALGYFESHREEAGTFSTLWLHAIMMPWIEKDPATAAQNLAVVLNRETDDIVRGGIPNTVFMAAETLSQKDPAAAMKFVADLPDWARPSARTSVAKLVHGDGRAAFLESLRGLPKGSESTEWQRAAATAMAPVDSTAAGAWIDSLGLVEEDQRETTRAVFESWKQHDPRAAVEWAAARLPEAEKAVLMTRAVESWAAREPNECGKWLGGLEAAPEYDHAVAAFARLIKPKDPDSARAWAERITDPQIRSESMRLLEK